MNNMSDIILIVAIDENNGIGYQNRMLFHVPNDLKRFKALTTGYTVIMGRRTFESLPKGALPNRRNIILSRTLNDPFPNTELFKNIEDAIDDCKSKGESKIFIIGGDQIYKQSLPLATKLEITEIHAEADNCDSYFPIIDKTVWKEIAREKHQTEMLDFDYVTYIK